MNSFFAVVGCTSPTMFIKQKPLNEWLLLLYSTLQSKAKKGAKKNRGGFATPLIFFFLFLVFTLHFVGF
jgi:hypothetical protein